MVTADYEVKPIRNAIVMLTNQCNCRCVYCFENRSQERMSLDTAKATLRFIHSSGPRNPGFTFFGGEPMLEFDTIIRPLVEYSKEAFSVPTRFAMQEVQWWLGHESYSTTDEFYGGIQRESKQHASGILQGVLLSENDHTKAGTR